MKTGMITGWTCFVILVLAGLVLPGHVRGQDETGEESGSGQTETASDPEDEKVIEELAKAEALLNDGKITKATSEVRKLWEKTKNLRAGYALSQLLQKQGLEQASKNAKRAQKFFVEGGELARTLLADPEFPAAVRDEVVGAVYNEACSWAATKDHAAALQSLKDSLALGYDDFDHIETDPDLSNLAGMEEFQTLMENGRAEIRERFMKRVRDEIAGFESFDFDFEQTDLADRPLSLKSLQGKIVIVDFWGTWCPPCRAEIPAFVKLKEKYSEHLEIVGLAYEKGEADEAPKKVIDFGLKNNINYPCAIGTAETKAMVPGFRGYPTTLFIDRTGKVRMVTVGAESYAKLEAIVLALMEGEG